ncbi:MAG: hypothetical protein KMY51_17485 [Desulfomicrobium sp.]|nr:hypothetical protein [Desulfomicrobium sp.]
MDQKADESADAAADGQHQSDDLPQGLGTHLGPDPGLQPVEHLGVPLQIGIDRADKHIDVFLVRFILDLKLYLLYSVLDFTAVAF